MSRLFFTTRLLILWLATGVVAMGEPIGSGYRLTFSEEFDRLDVSDRSGTGAKWFNRTPWNGDFGAARFAGSTDNGSLSVAEGVLTITLQKNATGDWTSGLISSMDSDGNGFAQKYGYFEFRAQLPEGEGVWPSFWLIGEERLLSDTTLTAEIDVMEHYGAMPNAFSSKWHIWHRDGSGQHDWEFERYYVEPGTLSSGYHTYGVLITEETTKFYFNGVSHWEITTPDAHHQPMIVLANLGLGGGWPITNEADGATMKVDYIRVYAEDASDEAQIFDPYTGAERN